MLAKTVTIGLCLAGVSLLWLVSLALLAEILPAWLPGRGILLVILSFLFLRTGPVGGTIGTILLALGGQAFSETPLESKMLGVLLAGLAMLHLSARDQWSPTIRGLMMCSAGGAIWQFQHDCFHVFASRTGAHETLMSKWSLIFGNCLQEAFWGGICWLAAAILYFGIRTVWKQVSTRPVRFGSGYE